MPDQDDKAKKLKEIQERLAEIQKKTAKPAAESKGIPPVKKAESIPKKVEKAPEKDNSAKPKVEEKNPTANSETTNVAKEGQTSTKKMAEPPTKKPEVPKKVAESAKSLTQEEKNWRSNKPKIDRAEKKVTEEVKVKGKGKNKLTKLYTIISLLVTLMVCSYFVYAFFIKGDSNEIVESKIPVEQVEEDNIEESESANEVVNENEADVEQEVEVEEPMEEAVVEEVKKEAAPKKVVQPKEEKVRPIATTSTPIAAVVPKGVIISYSSNSTKELASNNVQILKKKGFKAGYYYMPDKNAAAPSLYKVYVGPYSDESAAMSDFRKIVEINDKAFILRAD